MKKMAAKFSHMAKMGAEPAKLADVEDEKAKKEEEKSMAKMSVLEATNAQLMSRLSSLEAAEKVRTDATQATKEQTFAYLADQAIAGGYPMEQRDALVKFARLDFEGAKAAVSTFLPKTGAPAQVFSMLTASGAPIGMAEQSRQMTGIPKPRTTQSMGRKFVEDDSPFGDEIQKLAQSKDAVTMSKIDAYIPENQRSVMFYRLMAAEKVVRSERPDLAEAAE